jgi:hypothetical protein
MKGKKTQEEGRQGEGQGEGMAWRKFQEQQSHKNAGATTYHVVENLTNTETISTSEVRLHSSVGQWQRFDVM